MIGENLWNNLISIVNKNEINYAWEHLNWSIWLDNKEPKDTGSVLEKYLNDIENLVSGNGTIYDALSEKVQTKYLLVKKMFGLSAEVSLKNFVKKNKSPRREYLEDFQHIDMQPL